MSIFEQDRGFPDPHETPEQYYRRTGRGFYQEYPEGTVARHGEGFIFVAKPRTHVQASHDRITRALGESNEAYACRLRAIADKLSGKNSFEVSL